VFLSASLPAFGWALPDLPAVSSLHLGSVVAPVEGVLWA
jgi:hypothetical protein